MRSVLYHVPVSMLILAFLIVMYNLISVSCWVEIIHILLMQTKSKSKSLSTNFGQNLLLSFGNKILGRSDRHYLLITFPFHALLHEAYKVRHNFLDCCVYWNTISLGVPVTDRLFCMFLCPCIQYCWSIV